MNLDEINNAIALCKQEMRDAEQVRSYAGISTLVEVSKKLTMLMREQCKLLGSEYATPVSLDLFIDQRTADIAIIGNQIADSTFELVFSHAARPGGGLKNVSTLKFCGTIGIRFCKAEYEEIDSFPLGMVGVDQIGIYEVVNSAWKQNQKEFGSVTHYFVFFRDCIFEFLSRAMIPVTSIENESH